MNRSQQPEEARFLVVGAGIMGLAVARELLKAFPQDPVVVIEKESDVARHASTRNSGVIHAGFYYPPGSRKARHSRQGNLLLKAYCRDRLVAVKSCGQMVVARDPSEVAVLRQLYERGRRNGVPVELISASEACQIEPNLKTTECALWSPTTGCADPVQLANALAAEVAAGGGQIRTQEELLNVASVVPRTLEVTTNRRKFLVRHLINCAGLYADRVAAKCGLKHPWQLLPVKGLYLQFDRSLVPVGCHVYGVPNPANPFLGVHFTVRSDDSVMIGPTATPALWREQYSWRERFSCREFVALLYSYSRLLTRRDHPFRQIALAQLARYQSALMVSDARSLVRELPADGLAPSFRDSGIRAQLVERSTLAMAEDFIVAGDDLSTHLLNIVSPGWTAALSLAEEVGDRVSATQNRG